MTSGPPPPRPSTARTSAPPLSAMRSLPRPRTVVVAFWLWVAAAAFAVVTAGAAVVRMDALRAGFLRAAKETEPSARADTIERVADLSVLVVVGGGLLLGVLGVLLAVGMWAGRGWTRVALVLVALLVAGYAALVVVPMGWPVLAAAGVAVLAAVWMCLPGGRAWFG